MKETGSLRHAQTVLFPRQNGPHPNVLHRNAKPKAEANHPDYYTHTADDGNRDETAEKTLQEIESRAAPVICKLRNPQFLPSPEQMGNLYLFTAFMFARVPSWREDLDKTAAQLVKERFLRTAKDKEKFHKMCAEFEKSNGPLRMDYEKLRHSLLKDDYEFIQASVAFSLGSMFESGFSAAEELQHFGYEILYAPESEFFLTSDSPVSTLQPDGSGQATIGMGFGWHGVEVFFPLNKRACIRLKRGVKSGAMLNTTSRRLALINKLTMMNAAKHLYSSEPHHRISRLFNQWGCRIKPGENAFMTRPQVFPGKKL